jgi:hypothetical protein
MFQIHNRTRIFNVIKHDHPRINLTPNYPKINVILESLSWSSKKLPHQNSVCITYLSHPNYMSSPS